MLHFQIFLAKEQNNKKGTEENEFNNDIEELSHRK